MRAVAFDLDDTLAPSKSRVPERTVGLLSELLDELPVCVISGGRFEQFQDQLLSQLSAGPRLAALHLMPTCGTRYYRWHDDADWGLVYSRDMTGDERRRVFEAVERAARDLGLWEPDDRVTGDRIEDRGSQVTYSALGQRAEVTQKKAWDPDGSKRARLALRLGEMLPDLDVRSGGSTSLDITAQGVDKAYGIRQFASSLDIRPAEILFIGDRLEPGGNDYPVRALGVQARQVADHVETVEVIEDLLRALRGARHHGERSGPGPRP
ncbi:HAD-IIB family hydrolase [uncultured Serinicoccus sp.]|uniref:HAD-IIB family hydrolase n=1 Tax=uncultured Serinicoccus sp. TaxID=735514 RepID=UPI0026332E09|nr:HAD-IIB family hydrolase [uncultured Serinicoccus sp.]